MRRIEPKIKIVKLRKSLQEVENIPEYNTISILILTNCWCFDLIYSGLVPDIVFNPHGFPSRMTIAMMIEIMAGKSAALHGLVHDASPFRLVKNCKLLNSYTIFYLCFFCNNGFLRFSYKKLVMHLWFNLSDSIKHFILSYWIVPIFYFFIIPEVLIS